MSNIKILSPGRVASLEKKGLDIKSLNIEHMRVPGQGLRYDWKKATNTTDKLILLAITKVENRQKFDENHQIKMLKTYFGGKKIKANQYFIHQGSIYTKETVPQDVSTDIDATLTEGGNKYYITCRTNNGIGGSQERSFREMVSYIKEAPALGTSDIWLVIYVNGSLYHSNHKEIGTFYSGDITKSRFDILRERTLNKQCIVITDEDFPKNKTSFSIHFGINELTQKATGTI